MAYGDDILQVENLSTSFLNKQKRVRAVDNVSFAIKKGKTLGLVGESGSGKSVTSLSIMRLIDRPGQVEGGSKVILNNRNILDLPDRDMRTIRGNEISMIFQEPMTSLNPVFTIGDQVSEVFRIHQKLTRQEAKDKTLAMLDLVKIPAPKIRFDEYPHQLSGGMRQRVMIAMALACRPKLLIADEPTTALDVTIQAQILNLMSDLQAELNMAILLITHDLGVVAEVCHDVCVMYAGRIVEKAPVEALFKNPRHPYTVGLLQSVPRLGHKQERLPSIEGQVPSLGKLPVGCAFQDRCPKRTADCSKAVPELTEVGRGHQAACWRLEKVSHV